MTAHAKQSLEYLNESTFGDTSNTTWAKRIPVTRKKVTPLWDRIMDESIMTRQNDSRPAVLGPREADLEFTTYIPGGNAVPSTTLSEPWFADLLGNALGATVMLNSDDTCAAGSGVASIVSSTVTIADGSMFPVGVRGTRAGGQFIVVGSAGSGTTHASLVAVNIAPTAGDQIWDAANVYPTESGHVSQAFVAQHGDSGSANYLHGAFCTGLTFNIPIGGPPTCDWRYKVAVPTWPQSASFPAVATLEDCRWGPVMNGVLWLQAHGTTTRAVYAPSNIKLDLDLGTAEKRTLAGTGSHQVITGWERTKCVPRLTLTFPAWDNSWNTIYAADGSSTLFKHIMFQANTDATGRRWGFYMPRCYALSPEPHVDDVNGLTGTSITFIGTENVSPEDTTDLMKSAIRFAFA